MKKLNKKDLLRGASTAMSFAIVGAGLLAIVAGVVLVKQVQNLRSRASAYQVSLYYDRSTVNVKQGDTFTVTAYMNTNEYNVSAANIAIRYNPDVIALTNSQPGAILPVVLQNPVDQDGVVKMTFASQCNNSVCDVANGLGKLVTLTFTAVGSGETNIEFLPTIDSSNPLSQVAVIQEPADEQISLNLSVSKVIVEANPTATPVPTPTEEPEPSDNPSPSPSTGESVEIKAFEDAHVKGESDRGDNNYATESPLVASDNSDNQRIVYLKFDLSNINTSDINEATLKLEARISRSVDKQIRLVADNSWSESTITFNNAPVRGSVVAEIHGSVSDGQILSIPLDTNVIKQLNSNTLSIAVDNMGSGNTFTFTSKDENTANPPTLIINGSSGETQTPTPRPTPAPTVTPAPTATPTPPPHAGGQMPPDCTKNLAGQPYNEFRTFFESQSWWWLRNSSQTGDDFGHLHLGTCFPHGNANQPLSGTVSFDIRVIMHDNPGELRAVGYDIWADDPSGACHGNDPVCVCANNDSSCAPSAAKPLTCGEGETCVWWFPNVTADLNRLGISGGRKEFRFRAFVLEPDNNQMFESTGWQSYVAGGSNHYRNSDIIEARGWYEGSEYQAPRFERVNLTHKWDGSTNSDPYTLNGYVKGTWRPVVDIKAGAGGQPTDHHIVMVDPAFHANPPTEGVVVKEGSGELDNYQLSIDTTRLTNGWHRLALRADDDYFESSGTCASNKGGNCDSTNSGLMIIWFYVNN